MILGDRQSKPEAASLAIERSFEIQSKAFERSVNKVPLFKQFPDFSVMTRR